MELDVAARRIARAVFLIDVVLVLVCLVVGDLEPRDLAIVGGHDWRRAQLVRLLKLVRRRGALALQRRELGGRHGSRATRPRQVASAMSVALDGVLWRRDWRRDLLRRHRRHDWRLPPVSERKGVRHSREREEEQKLHRMDLGEHARARESVCAGGWEDV